jgi:DNA-binding NarL/FixJ family response regulator
MNTSGATEGVARAWGKLTIGEATRGVLQAAEGRRNNHPDTELALLDLGLADRDRQEILAEFGEPYPNILLVVLSDHRMVSAR